ncbi:repeat protein [Bifidobacterium ramosum]|uniref:Repeat protein n=1 Tax=Bifidobacterium ramosum TaxID=1798158 RepID=A0A6L4X201_9BIFI|nr:Ig-like domain-containing protein [Bifidobacterium ramosum]KAB8288620.1 repeat protein [Bifidobacterium ramosum]NEG71517.1 hypothetical protein [Bifidobacterium ramosum]
MDKHTLMRRLAQGTGAITAVVCLAAPLSAVAAEPTISSTDITVDTDTSITVNGKPVDDLLNYAVTVTYDGNGATGGSTADTTGKAGDTLRVANNGFTRDGYTFTSWNTLSNGTGITLLPNAVIPKQLLPTVKLYAQWKQNPDIEIPAVPQSVDDVSVETFAGTAPDLPSTVTVRYSDNTTKQLPVTWDSNRDWTTTRPSSIGITLVGAVDVSGVKLLATATVTVKAPFTDVNRLTPHDTDIYWLSGQSIARGYTDGTFRGMTPVYRQDMAAFLYRLAGSPSFDASKAKNPFSDVTSATPHYKEILWLASTGITTGWAEQDGTVTFRGMKPVVRQDMAAFLRRFAVYQGNAAAGTYTASDADKGQFVDVTDDTPHAQDIWWLAGTKVATGYTNHTYRGMNNVVRQDMAAFLHRMKTNVK